MVIVGCKIDRQTAELGWHVKGWRMVLGLRTQHVAERAGITRGLRGSMSGSRVIRAASAIGVGLIAVTGCASALETANKRVNEQFLPGLGAHAGFDLVSDWRTLDRPPPDLRAYFDGHGATYRVIESTKDSAVLAVWQTARMGGEPVGTEETAIGKGCVAMTRVQTAVESTTINCPAPLDDSIPYPAQTWGSVPENMPSMARSELWEPRFDPIRELMLVEPDGTGRRTGRTFEQIVIAIKGLPGYDHGFAIKDATQQGRKVTAVLVGTARQINPLDTRQVIEVQACKRMTVDLDATIDALELERTDCPSK